MGEEGVARTLGRREGLRWEGFGCHELNLSRPVCYVILGFGKAEADYGYQRFRYLSAKGRSPDPLGKRCALVEHRMSHLVALALGSHWGSFTLPIYHSSSCRTWIQGSLSPRVRDRQVFPICASMSQLTLTVYCC